MKNKKVLVTLKYFKGELNPFDCSALECALELGCEDITVLTMSPPSVLEQLKSLTRLGVKAILITDPAFAGSDTLATGYILSEAIKRINPDYVFCGRQSIDGDTAQVPPMLAKRLGYSFVGKVTEISREKFVTRDGYNYTLGGERSVITFERIRELRFPSIFSKVGQVDVIDNLGLGLDVNLCGEHGSPTKVVKTYVSNEDRRFCRFISLEELPSVIELALKKDARKTEEMKRDEKLNKIAYVGNVKDVAQSLSENVVEIDGELDICEVKKRIIDSNANTVLFSDEDRYKVLASYLAVEMSAGLCADCISFSVKDGRLIMTRPAYGGDITADIVCKSDYTFATVRTNKKSKSELVFSVGKGAIGVIDKVKAFADKFNAQTCSSRAVVDMGKMPYTAQVGLTGKRISPKVYVAMGISGAVQHTCAISGAGTVIAINKDKNARIFDYADYGVITEVENVEL